MVNSSFYPEELRLSLIKLKLIKEEQFVEDLIDKKIVFKLNFLSQDQQENELTKLSCHVGSYVNDDGRLAHQDVNYFLESVTATATVMRVECLSYVKEGREADFNQDRDAIDMFSVKIFTDLDVFDGSIFVEYLTILGEELQLAYYLSPESEDEAEEEADSEDEEGVAVQHLSFITITNYIAL